jgi:hypothetical protein
MSDKMLQHIMLHSTPASSNSKQDDGCLELSIEVLELMGPTLRISITAEMFSEKNFIL